MERKADKGREMIRLSLGKSDEMMKAKSRQSVRLSTTRKTKRGEGVGNRGIGRPRKNSAMARKRISMKKNWRQSLAIRDAAVSKLHKNMRLNVVMSEQKKTPVPAPKRISIKLLSTFEESNASALYDYEATADDEITIAAGERLKIVDRTSSADWWMVRKSDGKEGLVPATYVDIDEDAADECGEILNIIEAHFYNKNFKK